MIDQFDNLMDSICSVWKKGGTGIVDSYGMESQIFSLLVNSVPCRLQAGAGREIVTEASFGLQMYTFFMRPLVLDSPPTPLTIHHWLQVNYFHGVKQADPSPDGLMYDIKSVRNESGHHLEVEALLIEP
jgi:hypothetical protein